MMDEIADIMMERSFDTLDAHGNVGIIHLSIGNPYLNAEAKTRGKWRCPFQLTGIGTYNRHNAPGADSIEAFLNSLLMAKIFLGDYSRKNETEITWQGEEDLQLYPAHEALPLNENETAFDFREHFEEAFEDFFRTFGRK